MGGIASQGQLRMSLFRWTIVTVPCILLLGFASGRLVPSGDANPWYAAMAKPAATPPGWAFPVAWGLIYVALGIALSMILNARGAIGRARALGLFALGFVLALAWMPLFFGWHMIGASLAVIVAMVVIGCATAVAFGRIRTAAAWLMIPYLVWISFAAVLTWRIGQLNPDGVSLDPGDHTSQML